MDIDAIKHFVRCARQGHCAGSSLNEKTAARVADALHRIGDDLAGLDGTAITGLCDLIRAMSGPWPTDKSKEAVFSLVREAAGKQP